MYTSNKMRCTFILVTNGNVVMLKADVALCTCKVQKCSM